MTARVGYVHSRTGNCWLPAVIYDCRKCKPDSLCDVCHLHFEPRGDCSRCLRCTLCDDDLPHATRTHVEGEEDVPDQQDGRDCDPDDRGNFA